MAWRLPRQKHSVPIRPPKVAGTRAPDRDLSIPIERPHDFHVQSHGSQTTAPFQGCLLVGITTPITESQDAPNLGESWYDRWLVLRRPDGRLTFRRSVRTF